MFDEPALLLERTIHNLEVLADLFAAEAAETRGLSSRTSVSATCVSAEQAIQAALPKLQAAGDIWRAQIGMQPRMPACINCED
jgi:hypothetical protein